MLCMHDLLFVFFFCFFKQKTADDMRISDWSSDVCSSDLRCIINAQMQRNANSRHGVEDIMTAGHGHFDALDPPRGTVAVADHHIEAIAAGHWLDILPANVGLRAEAISNHARSEEHTSELQSLMRISYAVFCLKKKKKK